MQEYTLEQLKEFDGREGRPAYVAYLGAVYDVSDSAMWPDGDHEGTHTAGQDLTDAHDEAPHAVHIIDFPQVGTLVG